VELRVLVGRQAGDGFLEVFDAHNANIIWDFSHSANLFRDFRSTFCCGHVVWRSYRDPMFHGNKAAAAMTYED
jgi:hypothetical protein